MCYHIAGFFEGKNLLDFHKLIAIHENFTFDMCIKYIYH